MKIVHIINRLIGGGAEVMVPQIHRRHLEMGLDSWIVSMETGDDRGTEKVVSFGRKYPRWQEPFRLRRILEEMEKDGAIDIVHTHLTQSQLFAKFAIRGLRKRPLLVTTEHDTSNRRREMRFGRAFDRCLYSGYDRVVCISEGVQEAMAEWQPKLAARLVKIPNGVDLEPLRDLSRLPGDSGEVRLLSVGRLIPKKGFVTAIRALAAIREINWSYTIVGEGEQRHELEKLAEDLGIGERVRFAGYVNDVMPFYAESDVFLLPSLWEGFGLVAVEAMGAGLPVLASDVPGLAEVVGREGKAGWLLPVGDVEAWTRALREVFSDRGVVETMGREARTRAVKFSIEGTAEGYRELYEGLV